VQRLAHPHQHQVPQASAEPMARLAHHLAGGRLAPQHARHMHGLRDDLPRCEMTRVPHLSRRTKDAPHGAANL